MGTQIPADPEYSIEPAGGEIAYRVSPARGARFIAYRKSTAPQMGIERAQALVESITRVAVSFQWSALSHKKRQN
jgi:hypothetical protein